MNFSQKTIFISIVLLLTIMLFIGQHNSCDTLDVVNASLEIVHGDRRLLGFNTDRDGLHFGKVSPGATVTKTIFVNYTLPAQVTISANGSLSSWIHLNPAQFEIVPLQTQEVKVQLVLPQTGLPGKYTGQVEFCFREK